MLGRLERGKTLSEKAYDLLLEEIRGMAPGANKLPSEEDIASNYGISRATVREALKYLMIEGSITKVPGKGIYAHPSMLQVGNRVDLRSDFYSMMKTNYGQVTLEIESLGCLSPTPLFLKHFNGMNGEVFTMRWTYSAHGVNRIHGRFEFPVNCLLSLPPKDFWVSGLPEFGRKYLKAPVAYCSMCLKCDCNPAAAKVFGVPANIPLQCWQETIVDIEDNTVGFCEFFMHPTEMTMSVVTKFL